MSIEVHVQSAIRENYGAHAWDGIGECPQMWKNKSGDNYIISNAPSIEDAVDFVYSYIVNPPNEYFTEEILGGTEVTEYFQTEIECYTNGEISPVRVDWTSRFEKYPTKVISDMTAERKRLYA